MMIRLLSLAGMVATLAFSFPASAAESDLLKTWKTHKGGFVTFAPCDSDPAKACGTISALATDHVGPPPLDVNNPDPALQSRELLGLEIFKDFEFKGDDRWKNGTTDNNDNGKEYDSKLKLLEDGRLKVSGCVLFICESYEWDAVGTEPPSAVAE